MEWTIQRVLFVLVIALAAPCGVWAQGGSCNNLEPTQAGPCENISDTDCGMFYRHSFFPNNVTSSRDDAILVLTAYRPFYIGPSFQCSQFSHVFVCLALFPVCDARLASTTLAQTRPPCRSLCQRVYSDCRSRIEAVSASAFDFSCLLSCERYPETDCIALQDSIVQSAVAPPSVDPTDNTSASGGGSPPPAVDPTDNEDNDTQSSASGAGSEASDMNETESNSCPPPESSYFTSSAKEFAKGWIAFWSVVCFLSTLVTLLTFSLDPSRFHYPWRPVIYLALSFNIHSVGYFLALVIGRDAVTCPRGEFVDSSVSWHWGHTPCILVFGLLYYSMMAAFLWWLVLTFCWFLSSGFKWSNEAIARVASFFHVVAWVLPLLMTIILIAARAVSADELTGTCFIVRDDSKGSFVALLLGVVLPLAAFLFIGMIFLVIGFVSVLRIRSFMRHGGKEAESMILEKLLIRIGVFVTVYIIPATIVIACFIYELHTRPNWLSLTDTASSCPGCEEPNTAVFIVRILMFLLIGALTGIWIWSRKTVNTWVLLPERVRGCVGERKTEGPRTPGPVYISSPDFALTHMVLDQDAGNKN